MRKILYFIMAASIASCQSDEISPQANEAMGILDLTGMQCATPYVTRSVSSGLAVTIMDADGNIAGQYGAGMVPSSVALKAGQYTLQVYSDNQNTWQQAMEGCGEACYWGETQVLVMEEQVAYCHYEVPMTNYAVTLSLPSFFNTLFTAHTLTIKSGDRSATLQNGQKAYFSADAGFTYTLQVTNNEGTSYTHSESQITTVEAGKLYHISYTF